MFCKRDLTQDYMKVAVDPARYFGVDTPPTYYSELLKAFAIQY